jgi:hypothetical protein
MAAHAKLSPSSSHRWLHCPGAPQLCATVPRKPGSVYADEGTVAHALGERALREGAPPSKFLNEMIKGGERLFRATAEMCDAVTCYTEHINELQASLVGATVKLEAKLDLTWWIPGGFGTGDFVAVEPLGCLFIRDYKHGAGVPVEVFDSEGLNSQLGIYALGAVGHRNLNGVEEVDIGIVQPRAPHHDGPIRSHRMAVEDLLAWGQDVLIPGAKATQEDGAELHAGAWCRWCDALDVCQEARRTSLQAASLMFDDEAVPVGVAKPPDPATLTPDQLARIYSVADKVLEPWLKSVKASWQEYLGKNGPSCGYKLVAGRATRKWLDPDAVELKAGDLLGESIYEEPKLKSPAQMEKTLKSLGHDPKTFADLVTEKRGVSIAPVTDNRPALPAGVETMFEIEEE